MAHVWAARDQTPSGPRVVALKIIHSRFAEDSDFRAMFVDEARLVAAIEHPNVARVFELNDNPDQLYIVMEYIDGESLFGLVSQYRTAPIPVALAIAADAASGLHAVHTLLDPQYQPRNVVHRDVSPQNLLVSRRGEVKLIDFGIAHARDRSQKTTALGTVKGKIRYMAPEQARREKIGPWTDVFGLGATLFRVLVGKAPYNAESDIATTQALLQRSQPLVPFPPNFPNAVADVIKRSIAPMVADRYASAAELEAALRQLLAQTGVPDIGAWIESNMSDKTRSLRDNLAQINGASARPPAPRPAPAPAMMSIPDLVSPPAPAPLPSIPPLPPPLPKTAKGTEVMKPIARQPQPLPPTTPDQKRPPLQEPPRPGAPAFMDVHALVANANGVPDLPVPGPKNSMPARSQPSGALADQKLELAYEPSNRLIKKDNSGAVRAAILVVAGVSLVLVFLVAVPFIVKNRAIAQAKEAGFDMTAEHVSVGLGTATFRDVTLKATRVPGVTITIEQLGVTGVSVKELHAVGMDFQLTGDPGDWEMGLGLMLSENRVRFAGTPTSPRHYTIAGSHFAWTGVNGVGVDLADLGVDVETRGNGNEDLKANVGKLTYKTASTTVGPWGVTIDDTPTGNRTRVALDPAVPDGPSVLVVTSPGTAAATITVNVLRTPMANIGLKPSELGLPADGASEIESKMTGTIGADKIALSGTNHFWGLKVAGAPKPIDVMTTLGVSGKTGQPLDIDRTSSIAFGPFTAGVTGTVTPQKGSLRIDAIATALTLPCNTLTRAKSETMTNFATMMGALGQAVTGISVRGNISLSASLKYDTSDPKATSVTWLAKETCGLSIFGQ